MFRSISSNFSATKLAASVAAAALVAGMAVFLSHSAPQAKPHAIATQFAEAGRLPLLANKVLCSLTGWPNYEPACLFNLRASSGNSRTVRIIALR
jgi:hypothetical protein